MIRTITTTIFGHDKRFNLATKGSKLEKLTQSHLMSAELDVAFGSKTDFNSDDVLHEVITQAGIVEAYLNQEADEVKHLVRLEDSTHSWILAISRWLDVWSIELFNLDGEDIFYKSIEEVEVFDTYEEAIDFTHSLNDFDNEDFNYIVENIEHTTYYPDFRFKDEYECPCYYEVEREED